MTQSRHNTLVLACGALAKEVLALKASMNLADDVFDLQCLPANYHNYPDKIVPALKETLDGKGANYDHVLIGYGDCGTGGGLDRLLEDYPKAERLPGAHCYAFYAGLAEFDVMMEEELGSFFLTDYLVRHFKTLIIKGFGLERYPDLKEMYFKNYKRLIYISQEPTESLINEAREASEFLGLIFEHNHVGYGDLASRISILPKRRGHMDNINASIEVSPKQAAESGAIVDLFPPGGRVYITDVGTDSTDYLVQAAKRVRDLGYEPIPHFASRRMINSDILEDRVKRMVNEARVTDVLVIGGGLEKEAGEFASTMELLETGVFQRNGVTHMGIAGHPEGSPDFDNDIAMEALYEKQEFAKKTGLNLRIVTQFGFDAVKFINWAQGLHMAGITMPVHLGVAGPAKVTTLIKYAAMCGVGNSLSFLKKRGGAMATMVAGFDPNEVVDLIESHWRGPDPSLITQLHVFPFGGVKKSTSWLIERKSWTIQDKAF